MIILGDINSLLLKSGQITVSSIADEKQSVDGKIAPGWKTVRGLEIVRGWLCLSTKNHQYY